MTEHKFTDEEVIKEMAEIAFPFLDIVKPEFYDTAIHGNIHIIKPIENLYNAGYRKQSEGEWIKHPASYECTACKEEFSVEGYAEDYDPITDWDLHFCPNCGAKMKGEST